MRVFCPKTPLLSVLITARHFGYSQLLAGVQTVPVDVLVGLGTHEVDRAVISERAPLRVDDHLTRNDKANRWKWCPIVHFYFPVLEPISSNFTKELENSETCEGRGKKSANRLEPSPICERPQKVGEIGSEDAKCNAFVGDISPRLVTQCEPKQQMRTETRMLAILNSREAL